MVRRRRRWSDGRQYVSPVGDSETMIKNSEYAEGFYCSDTMLIIENIRDNDYDYELIVY